MHSKPCLSCDISLLAWPSRPGLPRPVEVWSQVDSVRVDKSVRVGYLYGLCRGELHVWFVLRLLKELYLPV